MNIEPWLIMCSGLSHHKSSHIHQYREVLYKGIRFSNHLGDTAAEQTLTDQDHKFT